MNESSSTTDQELSRARAAIFVLASATAVLLGAAFILLAPTPSHLGARIALGAAWLVTIGLILLHMGRRDRSARIPLWAGVAVAALIAVGAFSLSSAPNSVPENDVATAVPTDESDEAAGSTPDGSPAPAEPPPEPVPIPGSEEKPRTQGQAPGGLTPIPTLPTPPPTPPGGPGSQLVPVPIPDSQAP